MVDPEDEVVGGQRGDGHGAADVVQGREEPLALPAAAAAGQEPQAGEALGGGEEEDVGLRGDAGGPVEEHEAHGARARRLGVAPWQAEVVAGAAVVADAGKEGASRYDVRIVGDRGGGH